jgi:hypothetical protein
MNGLIREDVKRGYIARGSEEACRGFCVAFCMQLLAKCWNCIKLEAQNNVLRDYLLGCERLLMCQWCETLRLCQTNIMLIESVLK